MAWHIRTTSYKFKCICQISVDVQFFHSPRETKWNGIKIKTDRSDASLWCETTDKESRCRSTPFNQIHLLCVSVCTQLSRYNTQPAKTIQKKSRERERKTSNERMHRKLKITNIGACYFVSDKERSRYRILSHSTRQRFSSIWTEIPVTIGGNDM